MSNYDDKKKKKQDKKQKQKEKKKILKAQQQNEGLKDTNKAAVVPCQATGVDQGGDMAKQDHKKKKNQVKK